MEGQKEGGEAGALARVLTHPIRARLATILVSRPATAAELAEVTNLTADKVRYHLRILRREGIIDSSEERVRRGVIERTFFTTCELVVDDDEYEAMDEDERRRLDAYMVRTCFRDASDALGDGSMMRRYDNLITRVPLEVDEEGWEELSRIHHEVFEKVRVIKVEAGERLREADAEPIRATSILMCFEGPDPG